MEFSLTQEQIDIVQAVKETKANIMVKARAGAGKTSTIVEIAKAMLEPKALCLAFNKKIADEMQDRLPSTCRSSTLNALGYRAWMRTIGARVTLDTRKSYGLMKEAVDEMDSWDRKEITGGDGFGDVLEAIKQSKIVGYVPGGLPGVESVMTRQEFERTLEKNLTPDQLDLVDEVAEASFRESLRGRIDFDDQVLCPTVYNESSFDKFPLTLIDEAQDLSRLNHKMLQRVVGDRRLIAVGDELQAIYAFRGADSLSMEVLQEIFDMNVYKLTISFRCDQEIIESVQWHAPDMRWREDAPLGEVRHWTSWDQELIPDDGAIICRNNAPLFSMALNILESGRKPNLADRDVIKKIVKVLGKLGPRMTPKEEVIELIDARYRKLRDRYKEDNQINDETECLKVLASRCATLGDTISFAQQISAQETGIWMSTIHKSKGLEWDKVFLLDPPLIRVGSGQESNLLYVAQTRARHSFNTLTSDGYSSGIDAIEMPEIKEEVLEEAAEIAPVARWWMRWLMPGSNPKSETELPTEEETGDLTVRPDETE